MDKLLRSSLILIEIVLGICLICKPGKHIISGGFILMVIFVFYSILRILLGVDSNCGCFCSAIRRSPTATLTQNLILLICYFTAMLLNNDKIGQLINKVV